MQERTVYLEGPRPSGATVVERMGFGLVLAPGAFLGSVPFPGGLFRAAAALPLPPLGFDVLSWASRLAALPELSERDDSEAGVESCSPSSPQLSSGSDL